jgi:hypothetical protein
MATLQLTYDTGAVPIARIVDAFATHFGYSDTIDGQPNPESKAVFARRVLGEHIAKIVREEEVRAAMKVAEAAVTTINIV